MTIPEPADQIRNRKRRGTAGGRPPRFDRVDYRDRHVVACMFNRLKRWRAVATRYDRLGLRFAVTVTLWTTTPMWRVAECRKVFDL